MNMFVKTLNLGGAGPAVAIRDSIDVAGVPTQAGSRALADAAPAAGHAEVVERLLAAGYRITGKATMHELAFGTTGINAWAGTPVNPVFRISCPAARPAALPRRWRRGWWMWPSAPTPAARSAFPRPAAACSGSSRASAGSAARA
jgi:Asp-tRNA(Asn)/Glu-tRNA(Gln) amidotransferase A subunit family amidase